MTHLLDIATRERLITWLTFSVPLFLSSIIPRWPRLLSSVHFSHSRNQTFYSRPQNQTRRQRFVGLGLLWVLVSALTACGSSGGGSTPPDTFETSAAGGPPLAPPPGNQFVAAAANVTLNWPIPMDREDGSALPAAEIAGYEIVYQTSHDEFQTVNIPDPLTTEFTFNSLAPDDYSFAIMTYDSENRVSEASTLVQINKSQFPRL